jgi:hypothetical protein
LHQVGDLFELNVKLRFQKVKEYQQVAENRPQICSKSYSCRIFRGEGELILFDTFISTDVVMTSVIVLQQIYSRF